MEKQNQCKMILDWIAEHGYITAWEAMANLHIMRLASRIHDLKKLGYNIAGEMKTAGNGKRFKVYRLEAAA